MKVLLTLQDVEPAVRPNALLESDGIETALVSPLDDMRATIRREKPDIIVFSADLADPASVALVKEQLWSGAASVGLSDVADEEYLERLRSAGYVEIYSKPVSYPEVLAGLKRILERRRLQSLTGLIGESDAVREVMVQVEQMAPVTATVLVEGESGTGKELVARALHVLSGRKSRPFIAVNVGALPETLLESELFGHEKGAFTGAAERRLGRFELADTGTLFLDEIGEIPAATQVKLLRVLEEREFMRVGGTAPISVNVRVIAATNQPLRELVEAGASWSSSSTACSSSSCRSRSCAAGWIPRRDAAACGLVMRSRSPSAPRSESAATETPASPASSRCRSRREMSSPSSRAPRWRR